MNSLELWGGYECTVNRVRDEWHDQTILSGHEDRIEDLELFADLGIKSLRYPALWERISPQHPESRDFRWTDERFSEIRRLGMNPIVTLCHHGSGPYYTSLVDPSFATGLARHAAAVAERYPWIRDYTPVNEPLTTARFSALYGYWYPHTKDEGLFWTALLNEIDATRFSMREIRKVNPDARLIQTDDLGYCHSTEPLQCDADFQNERRWIGWDLLCGMVVPGHALWDHLCSFGLEERLREIAADPCPPDVIGINHYLASERFRDHRIELHPDRALADRDVGDCAGINFVDVDAIRNREEGVLGLPALIEQAWERYGRTIAITECHNGATREEQARWFIEVWEGAEGLRERGVDLVAVAAWSLIGSHDWNRMVTRFIGHYETGVFDVRGGTPRPTLMVKVLQDLAAGRKPDVPAIVGPGWWRRPSRLIRAIPGSEPSYEVEPRSDGPAPLLIVGEDEDLTRLAVRACEARGLYYARAADDLEETLELAQPWAVFDARDHGGICRGGAGASRRESCCPKVARACAGRQVPSARITAAPSWAPLDPLPGLLEIRTGEVYVPWDHQARPVQMLDALERGSSVRADSGKEWTHVYGPEVVDLVLDLLIDGMTGAVSVTGQRMTELDFARSLAMVADSDSDLVLPVGSPAEKPLFGWDNPVSWLPPCESTLERFVREARAARKLGVLAVSDHADEPHLGPVEEPGPATETREPLPFALQNAAE
jgi:dTDP-4-dehydrorhamnose reductase